MTSCKIVLTSGVVIVFKGDKEKVELAVEQYKIKDISSMVWKYSK